MLIFLLWASTASSQTYPDVQNTTVNDYADLLTPQDEDALSGRLTRLRHETGVEMTVLTIATQSDFAPDLTFEQFATGLFNHWSIGNARRNDGVLILIIRDDRVLRIELGAAYGRAWDRAAERIIDHHFVAPLAAGRFAEGIRDGSAAVINEIVYPFRQGEDAPSNSGVGEKWLVYGLIALFGAFSGRRYISDAMASFRSCPLCGQRGLRQRHSTTVPATRTATGRGVRRIRCVHYDYEAQSRYVIWRRSWKSSGGFGGGRSGGGGASGGRLSIRSVCAMACI